MSFGYSLRKALVGVAYGPTGWPTDRRPPPQGRTMCRLVQFTVLWRVNRTPMWDKAYFDSTNTPRVIIATIH
eukprot:1999586-Rhodomonas_salina.1